MIAEDLAAQLGRPVMSIEAIPSGHSGFTYFVDMKDGTRYVLRLPPPGAHIAGPADVIRQGRIMAALNAAGLPVPAIPAMSAEPVVDGRPFVLMEAVDGVRIEEASRHSTPEQLCETAIDVMKRLHGLPVAHSGIGDEEPVGLEAEMMRWGWLMQRTPDELTMRAGELGGLLAARTPPPREPALVHGDYHFGNMLFRDARVVAILDWEIAEIGQPLLDLGCLAVVMGRHPGEWPTFPTDELLEMYGVDMAEMRWYLAMSMYKYAAIFGYNLMLHRRGKRPDPMYEQMTDTIVGLIEEGIKLLA